MSVLIALSFLAVTTDISSGADQAAASEPGDRRFCTRIEQRSGSRMGYRRVCLTPREWRERLGPDWRQSLTGASPESDYDTIDARSRVYSTLPTSGMGPRPNGPR